MGSFQSQKKALRNLVISSNKQTSPREVLADANLLHSVRFDPESSLELKQMRRTDKTMSGKGTEFATEGQVTGWDSTIQIKKDLSNYFVGWLLAFFFGKDVVAGAGAPYTHAFTFDETTTVACATNIYLEDTSDVHYKVQDMAVQQFTLTIPERGPCTVDITMMGTGFWTPGSMGAVPALIAETYLLGSDAVWTFNGANFVGRVLTCSIKGETGVVSHNAPGGGLYGIFMRLGERKFSVDLTIAANNVDDIQTLFQNDTEIPIICAINSGSDAQATFTWPYAHIKANKIGSKDQMTIWSLSWDETTTYQKSGQKAFSATVINDEPTYLVAV